MSNAAQPAEAPPKSRRKLPLVIAIFVLLAAGSGGGYLWWSTRHAAAENAEAGGGQDAKAHAEAEPHGVLLPLDTFTVNLADPGATRFLRTSVQLVLPVEEDVLAELQHQKVPVVRARAAVLELLAEQKSDVINTPEGKLALKTEIRKRAGKALHHEITDVLFSDFVIQF